MGRELLMERNLHGANLARAAGAQAEHVLHVV